MVTLDVTLSKGMVKRVNKGQSLDQIYTHMPHTQQATEMRLQVLLLCATDTHRRFLPPNKYPSAPPVAAPTHHTPTQMIVRRRQTFMYLAVVNIILAVTGSTTNACYLLYYVVGKCCKVL